MVWKLGWEILQVLLCGLVTACTAGHTWDARPPVHEAN